MMILPFRFCDACRRWQELQIPGSVVFLAHHQGSGCAAIASIVSISLIYYISSPFQVNESSVYLPHFIYLLNESSKDEKLASVYTHKHFTNDQCN